jgi:pseudaminic acid cytidylyltransferase
MNAQLAPNISLGNSGTPSGGMIAVIPARGGSKRIPRKNVKLFAGLPMIAHSILAARDSGVFNRIIVSTDDSEIAEISKAYGAEVPFLRPEELADDHASTDVVFVHALELMNQLGGSYNYACCIYATAPFVRVEYLRQGLELLKESDATSAFSVASFPFPIFRGMKINERGRVEMLWPEHRWTRSQDLPEAYHDAGQFYWVNVERYLKEKKLLSEDAVPVVLPRWLVQDIDTIEDWHRAELMFEVQARDSHSHE